jgi:anion-transporting  ArsA/GET3 family ATPase
MAEAPSFMFHGARLVVCVGTGGVGKTTTSAAVALRAALSGLRVLVLTIDPAKRLANAMGLDSLSNEPQPVDLSAIHQGKGTLDAMMLDATASFDQLIRRTAGSDAHSILENRVYRVMADQFAGVQEYMALERLHDMYASGRWDLVVLDTPPAQNSVDFFTAPERVSAMFDERIMRWFLPAEADAGFLARMFNPGTVVLKLLAIIGGQDFIDELSEFFGAIRVVRASFKERGDEVAKILNNNDTHYIVVASPDARRVSEALKFQDELAAMGKRISFFVLNRSFHRFLTTDIDVLDTLTSAGLVPDGVAQRTRATYEGLARLGERDRAGIARLGGRVPREKIRLVPVFGRDIHTITELQHLASFFDRN